MTPTEPPIDVPAAKIRVGTWNVQYGREVDKNRLRLDVLTDRDADVWVLTETHDDLALSYPYQSIHTEQRYRTNNGGRWTSIWTRFPIIERIDTIDPSRTVCARLQADSDLELVVYGTVLPWMHDRTRDADNSRPAWSEFYRVTDQQAVEWKTLRRRHPSAALVVAGDLNHNLGGRHYYGTNKGRNQLREALAGAELECLTQTDNFSPTAHLWRGHPAATSQDVEADHIVQASDLGVPPSHLRNPAPKLGLANLCDQLLDSTQRRVVGGQP